MVRNMLYDKIRELAKEECKRRENMTLLPVPVLQQLWIEIQRFHSLSPFLLPLFLFSIVLVFKLTRNGSHKYPPSPPRLPLLGNLHQLGTLPHRSLRALSEKYGPVMLLKLGHVPTLVISSADMARDMIKTHDIVFSDRPKTTAANILLYGCTDVGFSPYGEYWKQTRKICVLELLGLKRVQSFQFVREEEVEVLISRIRKACVAGSSAVDLSRMLLAISNNIVSRSVLGQKFEQESGKSKFGELSRTFMIQFTSFSFGDMFPYLRWMDVLTGLISRLKTTSNAIDTLLDQVIEDHRVTLESDEVEQSDGKDFVHTLLQLQKDGMLGIDLAQDNLKAILLDMFIGGTDTTSTAMEWTMAELMKNPSKMKKVQEEVRRVVGKKPKIEMGDVEQMDYLKCVIKEALRMHPPAALMLPRETSAGITLRGYEVPARVTVFVNVWAIQRDPAVWDRPDEFLPERFQNNLVDFKGQDFQFIPFGAGRRGCPGMSFGVAAAELVMANILYWFNWNLCDGVSVESLDMAEAFGITVSKKLPLQLVPTAYTP